MLSAAFVINRARVRDVRQLTEQCGAVAASRGMRPSFLQTSIDDHGTELARGAIRAGARLIVAVGGDGTVRACSEALAGTGVPLAIVPRGTDVVGIFPGREAIIRLAGAVLAEQNDEWTEARRYMGQELLAACRRAGGKNAETGETPDAEVTMEAIPA